MVNLFVYGALMYEEVWVSIVSGKFQKIGSKVDGYRRLAVKNEDYPGVIKGEGTVEGYIWLAVDKENLERLDSFEGEYYERIPVTAVDKNGKNIAVNIYSFKSEYRNLLDDRDWSVEEFERSGLKKFISEYVGFDRV